MESSTTNISDLPLDPVTISQLVSGLQQTNGATLLPSRDIPTNTVDISTDAQVQPNYIPPTEHTNYIEDEITYEKPDYKSLDAVYDELQTPLLIAILFFMFQLPVFRKLQFRYTPFLFLSDGNLSLSGFILNSVLFGSIFYCMNKIVT